VDDIDGVARVGDGRVEGLEESEAVGDLAEEEGPGVGRDTAAEEVGDDGPAPEGGKVEWLGVTVCHAMAFSSEGWGCVLTQTLQ
jgi:hypothetical protein